MIYRKFWRSDYLPALGRTITYEFEGWFLFGFIPLYIVRRYT